MKQFSASSKFEKLIKEEEFIEDVKRLRSYSNKSIKSQLRLYIEKFNIQGEELKFIESILKSY